MKIIKWFAVFSAAFILAWVLIFTFTQEPFRATASARILKWKTPEIPIYLYVAGSFGAGIAVGLFLALYNYISLQAQLHKRKKECAALQEKIDALPPPKSEMDAPAVPQFPTDAFQLPKPDTTLPDDNDEEKDTGEPA